MLALSRDDGGHYFTQVLRMAGTAVAYGVAASKGQLWVWGDGAFVSDDQGRSWRRRIGMPVVALALSGRFVAAITTTAGCAPPDDGKACPGALVTSIDGGRRWRSLPLARTTDQDEVFVAGATGYAAIAATRLYSTSDAGRTWIRRRLGVPGIATSGGLAAPRIALAPDGVLWEIIGAVPAMECASQRKLLYRSNDAARHWHRVRRTDENLRAGCVQRLIAPAADTLVLSRQTSSTTLSRDGGATWTDAPFGSSINDPVGEWATFATARDGLAGADGARVYRTTDGGKTWTRVGLPNP